MVLGMAVIEHFLPCRGPLATVLGYNRWHKGQLGTERCFDFNDLEGSLAGAAGFEPANAGTKNRCLTTWRRPSRRPRMRGSGAYTGEAARWKPDRADTAFAL